MAIPSQRILVVDDEPTLCELVRDFLVMEGYEVDAVSDTQLALSSVQSGKYDLLLTDLNMGSLSGLELLSFVRKNSPNTSVMIITGYPSLDTAVEALRNGASEYLQKPIDFNMLREVVKRQLRATALQNEVTALNRQIRDERDNLRLAVAEAKLFRNFASRLSTMFSLRGVCEVLMQTIENVIALDVIVAVLPDAALTLIHERRPQSTPVFGYLRKSAYELAGLEIPESETVDLIGEQVDQTPVRTIHRELRIPITLQNKVVAALVLAREDDTAFTPKEQSFVRAIATQATDSFHRLNEVITQQRSRMQHVFDALNDGIILVEREHMKPLVNPQAVTMLELSSSELESTRLICEKIELNLSEELTRARKGQSLEEPPRTHLLTFERDSGTLYFEREMIPVSMPEANTTGILIILHNVTTEHEIESFKRKWVANTSHELRTPTAILKNFATLFSDGTLGELTTPQSDAIEVMQRNIKRLEQLIENLLAVSRLDRAVMDVKDEAVELFSIIDESIRGMRSVYSNKRMEIRYEGLNSIPLVKGDRNALQQVISNLLDNAYKYSDADTIVHVITELDHQNVSVTVSDQGAGIPPEGLQKIFDRFYRHPGSEVQPGLGLGLALVKELIERMGGTIKAQSTVGVGSSFRFEIPIYQGGIVAAMR